MTSASSLTENRAASLNLFTTPYRNTYDADGVMGLHCVRTCSLFVDAPTSSDAKCAAVGRTSCSSNFVWWAKVRVHGMGPFSVIRIIIIAYTSNVIVSKTIITCRI